MWSSGLSPVPAVRGRPRGGLQMHRQRQVRPEHGHHLRGLPNAEEGPQRLALDSTTVHQEPDQRWHNRTESSLHPGEEEALQVIPGVKTLALIFIVFTYFFLLTRVLSVLGKKPRKK